jgi:succinate dehydrogenase/fumarate reductase flavoprotein subunit
MGKSKTKVLIVGSGIAGMMAALKAAEDDAFVQVVSEVPLRRSSDARYQDGIAGVTNPARYDDSIDQHVQDTLAGGDSLAHQSFVWSMCENAPGLIALCDRMGVHFTRTAEGKLNQLKTGGHLKPRTAHADMMTGQQVVSVLDGQLRRFECEGVVERFEYLSFCSIVRNEDGRCCGIIAMDDRSHEFKAFPTDVVVLCTGGYAGLYGATTAIQSNGVEIAQAYLQGAQLANPEFVQFRPAAHYTMGGLWIDDNHMTTIPGLFAAGESEYAYHGANALGSNVILSELHAGMVAGEAATKFVLDQGCHAEDFLTSVFDREKDRQEGEFKSFINREEGENPRVIEQELKAVMDEQVGIVREKEGLEEAEHRIAELKERFGKCTPTDKTEWVNHELKLMRDLPRQLTLADVVVKAALAREESRGSHARSDHPARDDDNWQVITKAFHTDGGPEFNYDERTD